MKASFQLTTMLSPKKRVTFSHIGEQFKLNGIDVSKQDLTLILELTGHEVHETDSHIEFFRKTLHAFSHLSPEDFQIFDDFAGWDQEAKNRYREVVPLVRLRLSPPSLN